MLFIVSVLFAAAAPATAQLAGQQRQFFDDICDSTNIRLFPLSNPWCSGDPCSWSGVECNSSGSLVEKLNIDFDANLALQGTLPESIEFFSSLTEFTLYCASSFLKGNITEKFLVQNADTLEKLFVAECPLVTGLLPHKTGMPVLQEVGIFNTRIGKNLTAQFVMGSPNLVDLRITGSDLAGELPDAFENNTKLKTLVLNGNKLTGKIPRTLCFIPALETLSLEQNYLSAFDDCLADIDPRIACFLRDNYWCTVTTVGPCTLARFKDQLSFRGDICGVCGGDGTSCLGCDGIPDSGLEFDACGVCDGEIEDPALCPDCAGVIDGSSVEDACGVCNGDDSTCTDCNGVVNGSSKLDRCHVCNGDGNSCIDCYGQLYGTAKYDICGVCNGVGDTCDDCDGIAGGGKVVDACGVCGGSGLSCLDCSGQVNGTLEYDDCDVCGGDGTTCGIEFIRKQTASATDGLTVLGMLALGVCVAGLCPLCIFAVYRREAQAR